MISGAGTALEQELRRLTLGNPALPEPLDLLPADRSGPGVPVLIYEYQAGEDLWDLVEARGAPSAERAMALTSELAGFAQDLHEEGVVLRDLSPEHVVLGPDDIIGVVGLANARGPDKMDASGSDKTCWSPGFAAPEVAERPGPASDVYSLGATLFYLLTGKRLPPSNPRAKGQVRCLGGAEVEALAGFKPGLQKVVLKAIAFDPAARFNTAGDMADMLQPGRLPRRGELPEIERPVPVDVARVELAPRELAAPAKAAPTVRGSAAPSKLEPVPVLEPVLVGVAVAPVAGGGTAAVPVTQAAPVDRAAPAPIASAETEVGAAAAPASAAPAGSSTAVAPQAAPGSVPGPSAATAKEAGPVATAEEAGASKLVWIGAALTALLVAAVAAGVVFLALS